MLITVVGESDNPPNYLLHITISYYNFALENVILPPFSLSLSHVNVIEHQQNNIL